ncbi:unnamed protein product [Brassicogethes aeneus]|uniref:Regulatory protein zeste n=1 Tax=Brassicogethes aeneus TaxID=1431903 RepID=A0A9P0BEJ0_BRAAE|nr:unnamed protein product [Brassicogethes aeneus]
MENKQKRGPKASEKERQLMLELVEMHKAVLENKCTDATNNKKKQKAWENIECLYNKNTDGPKKTRHQLKILYLNYKRNNRRNMAGINKEDYIQKTETTDYKIHTPILSEEEARILALLKEEITPDQNTFDDSAKWFGPEKVYESPQCSSSPQPGCSYQQDPPAHGLGRDTAPASAPAPRTTIRKKRKTVLKKTKMNPYKKLIISKICLVRLQRRLAIKEDNRKEAEHALKIKILQAELKKLEN